MASPPPVIFAPARRLAARRRMLAMQRQLANPPRYLIGDVIADMIERLGFLRVIPARALVIGDWTGDLAAQLAEADVTAAEPAEGFDQEQPFPFAGFDFIAGVLTLDTANDLPGALIHLRRALAPGGLMIASLIGAGSLTNLRAAMLAADGDRPAPRLHPMVDVRAGGQLLQRAGFADPVVDGWGIGVSFRSLGGLVGDLRAQGLGNVLADPGPVLGREARARAEEAFAGRTVERFEILTLSGWNRM
jgi:SAM-dependent methyltransferase